MLLLFGMIDFAMVYNGQAVVSNAARDGARVASLGKKYATTVTTIQNETSGLVNKSTVNWTVCTAASIDATSWTCSGSTSGDTSSYDTARTIGWIVRVNVTYRYTLMTPLPSLTGIPNAVTVSQSSYMRIETTT